MQGNFPKPDVKSRSSKVGDTESNQCNTNDEEADFEAILRQNGTLKNNTQQSQLKQKERIGRKEEQVPKVNEEVNKKRFPVAEKMDQKKDTFAASDKQECAIKFKARKPQSFRPVEVKTNTTQTMREAAYIKREEEKMEKFIMSLTNGSLNSCEYENYIEELRQQKEIEDLETIERKKLQALITHEEALLARSRLIQKNKNEKNEYKKRWEEYERKMNEIREREMQDLKLQVYVETKTRERNIQCKIKWMADEKSKLVKNEQAIVKENEKRRSKQLADDMERKKELVHRIYLLRELAKVNKQAFADNSNIMVELTLAELRAKLKDMELEMKAELERKRDDILAERRVRQELLERTSRKIQESREAKRERRKFERALKEDRAAIRVNANANQDLKLKLQNLQVQRREMDKLNWASSWQHLQSVANSDNGE